MKKFIVPAVALAVVVFLASSAWAQRPQGGRFGGFGGMGTGNVNLLAQKSVQEELKLSEDQIKQVAEKIEKQRESRGEFRDLSREDRQKKMAEQAKANREFVAATLKEDQLKRFKQIAWQQMPVVAFNDPEVAQAINLTGEQKEKMRSIQEAAQIEMRELMQAGGGDRAAMREKLMALHKATTEKLQALLTTEQQSPWKELTGDPVKGEIQGPGFPGGNGPRRANNANRPA